MSSNLAISCDMLRFFLVHFLSKKHSTHCLLQGLMHKDDGKAGFHLERES